MADPKVTTRLIIQLGDGGDPTEVFAHTCGANAWGIKLSNSFGETTVLDCENPLDTPASLLRHLESQDTSATISGTVAKSSLPTWRGWADNADTKNVKLFIDESGADNGGFWLVPMVLSELSLDREGSGTASFSATIAANGRRVWTDAA